MLEIISDYTYQFIKYMSKESIDIAPIEYEYMKYSFLNSTFGTDDLNQITWCKTSRSDQKAFDNRGIDNILCPYIIDLRLAQQQLSKYYQHPDVNWLKNNINGFWCYDCGCSIYHFQFKDDVEKLYNYFQDDRILKCRVYTSRNIRHYNYYVSITWLGDTVLVPVSQYVKMKNWLEENILTNTWEIFEARDYTYSNLFYFKNEEDAVAFKLRWME